MMTLLFTLTAWSLSAWGASVRAQSLEYPVKANYLVRFAAFVQWPPDALSDRPLTLCVVGRDPFGRLLDDAVEGETVNGRRLAVRRLARIEAGSGCHIAFLGGMDDAARREAVALLARSPVLTVSDHAGAAGGMIRFVIDRNRVRFHIDNRAARDAGLSINSRLLSLALTVRGGE